MSLAYLEDGPPKHAPDRKVLSGRYELLDGGGPGATEALETYLAVRAAQVRRQRMRASEGAAKILGEMSAQWAENSQPSYLGLL